MPSRPGPTQLSVRSGKQWEAARADSPVPEDCPAAAPYHPRRPLERDGFLERENCSTCLATSQLASCLRGDRPAWKEAHCVVAPLLPQHSLSVHTALQGPSSPPSSLPPEGITLHLPVPQMQTTVKNRASLLVPVSSGTRCSHKHAGWQGLLGKRAGPEPGLLGTDIEKNE